MLTGLLGIRAILWMGPVLPLPPPAEVLNAVSTIQVTDNAEKEDGFQITFKVSKGSSLEYDLVASGLVSPFSRVLIGVLLGLAPEILMYGVVKEYHHSPSNEPGMSTLTVTGSDISLLFGLEDRSLQFPPLPDSAIFELVMARYASLAILPEAQPTSDVPIPLLRIPGQRDTDLVFIRKLAQRNGYVFYINPPTISFPSGLLPGTAYFGVENRVDVPQAPLSVNMGHSTNVKQLSFAMDAMAGVNAPAAIIDPITKQVIPIPALPPLTVPPLALMPTLPSRTMPRRTSAKLSPMDALAAALAAALGAPDSLVATGELDTLTYGNVLRAAGIVGVRGAGIAHDGFYKVNEVVHDISPSANSYTQKFTLKREGLGPISPTVG